MNILFSLPKDVMWSFVYSCPYFTLALNPLTVFFFSPDRFQFDNQPAVCILSLSTISYWENNRVMLLPILVCEN